MNKREVCGALEQDSKYLLSYACNMPSGRVVFDKVLSTGSALRKYYLAREDVIPLLILPWPDEGEGG